MKIAIDVSPLQSGHKIRGVGFYLEHLKNSLVKYFPQNNYIFFNSGEKIPSDVELVHFPYFEPFFLALPLYKKFKTVVTVHDLTPIVFPKAFPRGFKGELKWQMQKYALKRSDGIITDSNSSKKDVLRLVGAKEEKVSVVPLAAGENFRKLSSGKWEEEIKKKYNLPEKFVLYVGDVTNNKNIPRLLQAIIHADLPIVMVGKSLLSKDYDKNNPWNHDLNRVWELANEHKNIFRLGFISDDDLVKVYNLATVFVMPSLYEGFGLPVLEAMSSGCPVVATKEGSLPEVAREACLYIDAYNYKNMAEGIGKVFEDKNLQEELVKKGFENIKNFSWKKTAFETLEAYRKALG